MQKNKEINDNMDVYTANGGKFKYLLMKRSCEKVVVLGTEFSSHSSECSSDIVGTQGLIYIEDIQ